LLAGPQVWPARPSDKGTVNVKILTMVRKSRFMISIVTSNSLTFKNSLPASQELIFLKLVNAVSVDNSY
jgi:hypothetical protein